MAVAGTGQLSLFDADVAPAGPGDLEGLLAGPGQVVRLGGTARISVVVADAWRVPALLAEFASRGVSATGSADTGSANPGSADTGSADTGSADTGSANPGWAGNGSGGTGDAAIVGHIGVRTAFSACLAPIAVRWIHGAVTRPPDGFTLNGSMLRLWFIAAGRAVGPPGRPTQGVMLRLSANQEAAWRPVRAALARAGFPGALLGSRAGGPAYRIVGRRRVARFAELVGARPEAAPPGHWPR